MKNNTRKWIRAGFETLITGGAAAAASTISAATIDSTHFALLSASFFKLLGSTFVLTGGLKFLTWWSANPLPPESDTTPQFPVAAPQMSLNPFSKAKP